jgi:hypothetical protein
MSVAIRLWLLSMLATLAMLAMPLPFASAHHSFALFDRSKTTTITGTIRTFEYVNPHAWIWVNVANDQGSVDVYGLETAGTSMLRRMGIPRDTFKPGDKVTMVMHPLKSGEKGGEWRHD